jgi:aspartate 1-decarboxylase
MTYHRHMLVKLLKAKIHRATVTFTDVEYPGSVTVDPVLLRASGLMVNEAVLIADCDNGHRFETYIIPGEEGQGQIGINGAAARLTEVGHKVILLGFAHYDADEAARHDSTVVVADEANGVGEIITHRTGIPPAS